MNQLKVAITTIDNPFDPFDEFDKWFDYDTEKGYYTSSKIARLTETSDDMTDREEAIAYEDAINRLIEIDPLDIYKKVTREDAK